MKLEDGKTYVLKDGSTVKAEYVGPGVYGTTFNLGGIYYHASGVSNISDLFPELDVEREV